MIALVMTMIRYRIGAALTVAALSVFAVAAAAAAPTFTAAAERSVVTSVLDQADASQLVVSVDEVSPVSRQFNSSNQAADTDWAPKRMPGFSSVLAVETDVAVAAAQPRLTAQNAAASDPAPAGPAAAGQAGSGPGAAGGPAAAAPAGGRSHPRMVYRAGLCDHLRMVAGVCSTRGGEVMLGVETARSLDLRPGDPLVMRTSVYEQNVGWVDGDQPFASTVVGIYELADAGDPYWGRRAYVAPFDVGRATCDVLFVGMSTMAGSSPTRMRRSVDAALDTAAVDPANRARIAGEVAEAIRDSDRRQVISDLPELFRRMDSEIAWVDILVPLVAMPLIALCWFVMFMAVASGTAARRDELALVALRGLRGQQRWWLTVGESALPMVLAAVPGYLLGVGCVRLLAPVLLPHRVPVAATATALAMAGLALAGALGAGMLAARGQLRLPVVELLRGAAVRSRRRWAWAAETLIVVLAALAALQLRSSGGELAGIGQLVPALLVLAVGLCVWRLLRPAARLIGDRAGRRGRTGALLAARHLARPGGAGQLVPLIAVAVALLGFCGISAAIADRTRATNAEVALGADRVLQVREVSIARLLAATRSVDPRGRYAMAAVRYEARNTAAGPRGTEEDADRGSPQVLAVDSQRLASVALWPGGAGRSAGAAAALLRPSAPSRPSVRGAELLLDLSVRIGDLSSGFGKAGADGDEPAGSAAAPTLSVVLVADDDTAQDGAAQAGAAQASAAKAGTVAQVEIPGLTEGRRTYAVPMPCAAGCRVGQVVLANADRFRTVTVTVHQVRQRDAAGTEQPAPAFGGDQIWAEHNGAVALRPSRRGTVTPGPLVEAPFASAWSNCVMQPVATPRALPVLVGRDQPTGSASAELGQQIAGVDGVMMPVATAGTLGLVPGSGTSGYLVDLEYLGYTASPQVLVPGEVLLSADAPADAVERLTRAGLVVLSQRRLDAVRRSYTEAAPAVANRFTLVAAGFAVLLAVGAMLMVAAVDRRATARYLRALRVQGVAQRTVRGVAVRLYCAVAAVGALAGVLGAGLAWFVVGPDIPVFSTMTPLVPPPHWPDPLSLVPQAVALLAVLGIAVAVSAAGLTRAARAATETPGRTQ